MAAPTQISTLADVQNWLGTLAVGQSVSIDGTLFTDAQLMTALFNLFPSSELPFVLTVDSVDVPSSATLVGSASVLGEPGNSKLTFDFSETSGGTPTLQCTLTIVLPQSVQWNFFTTYNVAFSDLTATFQPDADLGVIRPSFTATVNAGAAISINVTMVVPTYDGNWLVQAGEIPQTNLTPDALQQLAGGDIMGILPSGSFSFDDFSLTSFELAFNIGSSPGVTLISVGLSYKTNWTLFNGVFQVQNLSFQLTAFPAISVFQATVDAQMEIGGGLFDVGAQFPGNAVYAQIAPSRTLLLSDVFTFFGLQPPAGFPSIGIDVLGFVILVSDESFTFNLGIGEVPIFGNVFLNDFLFDISATVAGGRVTGSGDVAAQFTIASTTLTLRGSYASGAGLSIQGTAVNVDLGGLIGGLATTFGVSQSSIPQPIQDMTLSSISVSLNTGTNAGFTFALMGMTQISGVGVTFAPTIDLAWSNNQFSAAFSGTVTLAAGQSTYVFTVDFDKDPATTSFQATYSGTEGLSLAELADVFGFELPQTDLDLDLTAASFIYDSTNAAPSTGTLVFGAQSERYGNAVFVRVPISGTTQSLILIDANQTFSLTNLPLVGAELAQIENVQVDDLTVIISSLAPVTQPDAAAINTVIGFLSGSYPLMPSAGIDGMFLIAANLSIGSDPPAPLSVALGGPATAATALAAATTPAAGSDGVTWFTIQQSFGPVSLQRIGVMFQNTTQTLWFEIDATLNFGPLQLVLVGLGIGAPIKTFDPQFSLAGLGISYSNLPLTVAGSLVNLAPAGASSIEFEGGVTIGTGDFVVQAFGYYGNQNGFNSLFIFGDLAYDFGGPPAFFVTGVALGFGYNSDLTVPTIDQVGTFPFVQVLPTSAVPNTGVFGSNPDPQTVLATILQSPPTPPWVVPQAGTLWFAAGITFTSFELLNSQALVIVETGSDLVIALVGTSRAQFPQAVDTTSPQQLYANIELDLLVRFAPSEGVFSLQAVLDPSSFLLTSACVLTGGFAFFVWFGTNPHAGDFVLTLGGYNPGFTPPSYYPTVPAVGFHWSIDSSITVSGGTYFAFTPAVLMLGGELSATYQAGNLTAWFDAHADVLIRWKPFWFTTNIGVTVGASYKLDLLFTSVTISVELGCNLTLWGPPTGGSVTVDWVIISFTIPFGQPVSSAPPIDGWHDVESMLPRTSGSASQPSLAAGTVQVLSISPVSGIAPGATTGGPLQAAQWTVRGSQFAFSTSTPIPASTATVGSTYSFNGSTFNVYPLVATDPSWQNISATHAVTITANGTGDYSSSFQVVQVQQAVPAALWGSPPEDAHGQPQTPDPSSLVVPNQIVGLSASVNPPQMGGSAGPIDVIVNLAGTDLGNSGANLPLSNQAQPPGDVAVNSPSTVATIAGSTGGIAAQTTIAARNAIYAGLQSLGYAPVTNNDSMVNFSGSAGCTFAAEPLLVS